MPPTQTERVRQLEDDARDLKKSLSVSEARVEELAEYRSEAYAAHAKLSTEVAVQRVHLDRALEQLRESQGLHTDSQKGLNALRQDYALLQQRHDDHVRRAEVWGQRWWALVPLLVGAVLTLCSGLVVALARK